MTRDDRTPTESLESAIAAAFSGGHSLEESLAASARAIHAVTGIELLGLVVGHTVAGRGLPRRRAGGARQAIAAGETTRRAAELLCAGELESAVVPLGVSGACLVLGSHRPGDLLAVPAVRAAASGLSAALATREHPLADSRSAEAAQVEQVAA